MLQFLTLIFLALIYIRPTELVESWKSLPAVEIGGAIASVGLIGSLVVRPRLPVLTAQDWFMMLFYAAIVISLIAMGWAGGGLIALEIFAPVVLLYVLLACSFPTSNAIRRAATVWLLLNLFLAINGINQYFTGVGFGGVTMVQGTRIRATGLFNDPNDLGMSLVMVLPFALTHMLHQGALTRRLFGAMATATLLYAIFLTNSRGAVLGTAAVIGYRVMKRYGKLAGIVPAVVLLGIMLAAGPSRMSELNADEESAQSRVQAWSSALVMFKQAPITGVGAGMFAEHHERVAHNSYVHSMAELGVIGLVAFIGFIYMGTAQLRKPEADAGTEQLRRDLLASVIGTLVCITFLSRGYAAYLYVPFGLAAAYGRISGRRFQFVDGLAICGSVVGVVILTYIAVQLLAVF